VCLKRVLTRKKFNGMIIFEEALMLFEPLGINEPKPKNTKNMKYEDLDLKSIKLIN
jgi:hypothetical protein